MLCILISEVKSFATQERIFLRVMLCFHGAYLRLSIYPGQKIRSVLKVKPWWRQLSKQLASKWRLHRLRNRKIYFPSSALHCANEPTRSRNGNLNIFSIFHSCLQKNERCFTA